jgi:hypothetical protein
VEWTKEPFFQVSLPIAEIGHRLDQILIRLDRIETKLDNFNK